MENIPVSNQKVTGRIKVGDVIKHPRFLDVACLVNTIHETGDLTVFWINQGFTESWIISKNTSRVSINKDWLLCDTPNIKCLRYSSWSRV